MPFRLSSSWRCDKREVPYQMPQRGPCEKGASLSYRALRIPSYVCPFRKQHGLSPPSQAPFWVLLMKRQRGHSDICLLVGADSQGQGPGPGAGGRRELWKVLQTGRRKARITQSQLGKTPREELESCYTESKFSLVWGMEAGLRCSLVLICKMLRKCFSCQALI